MEDEKIKRIKKLLFDEFPESELHYECFDYRGNEYCYPCSAVRKWKNKLLFFLNADTKYKCDECKEMFYSIDLFSSRFYKPVSELTKEQWEEVKNAYNDEGFEVREARGYSHGFVCLECRKNRR